MAMVSPQKAASGVVVYAVLTAIGIFFLAPFLWLVLASVNPSANLSVSVPTPRAPAISMPS